MLLEPKVSKWNLKLWVKISLGIVCSLVFWFGLGVLLYSIHPEEGMLQFEELAQSGGLLIGISIAFPIESRFVHFNPRKYIWPQKILGAVIALVITLGVYFGLSIGFEPFEAPQINFILRGIRYFILALAAGLFAPWLLTKIFKK